MLIAWLKVNEQRFLIVGRIISVIAFPWFVWCIWIETPDYSLDTQAYYPMVLCCVAIVHTWVIPIIIRWK